MEKLIIIGTGGCGKEALQLVEDINADTERFEFLGFIDDAVSAKEVSGFPVLGKTSDLPSLGSRYGAFQLVIGIGSPKVKRGIQQRLKSAYRFPTLIHPSAQIGKRVTIGEGVLITAGCLVTVDVRIGDFTALNIGCSISHDSQLAPYTLINPGARIAGSVSIGEGAYVGIGAVILEGRMIGEWSVVGAGAVVREDVQANTVVAGVPARVIRTKDSNWHLSDG